MVLRTSTFGLFLAVVLSAVSTVSAAVGVTPKQGLPTGLAKDVAAALNESGFHLDGPKGAVCDIWFAKKIPLKPDFKPSLSVKYPLLPGEFIGVIQVAPKSEFTDFRGQPIKAGVYTLRYGQQPQDGNHVGTSDLSDFLLAIPIKFDKSPKRLEMIDKLHRQSARTAGATHPAIFSLLPVTDKEKAPALAHDAEKHRLTLTVMATGEGGGKAVKLPLKVIVFGKSEG